MSRRIYDIYLYMIYIVYERVYGGTLIISIISIIQERVCEYMYIYMIYIYSIWESIWGYFNNFQEINNIRESILIYGYKYDTYVYICYI